MKRYICADLLRLFKRVQRDILIVLSIAATVVILCVMATMGKDPTLGNDYASQIKGAIGLLGFVFGLLEIIYIYGDDFKAKSMQIAIGSGISRRRIVNSKWVIMMIMVAIDLIILTIALLITAPFVSIGFSMKSVLEIIACVFYTWLSIISSVGAVAILFFAAQGIGLGVLLYIGLQFGLFTKMLDIASALLKIEKWHLSSYELTSLNNVFGARLELGNISFPSLIGILIYMVLSFVITEVIFRHRELEF